MPELIHVDGSAGSGSGQLLRASLALSAVTGQPFEMSPIRPRRARPGLLPPHVAAVRAVALVCGASASGAFDGSPTLRFEPGPVSGGEFRFEVATSGAATLLGQTVAIALGAADRPSRLSVTGPTHLPGSPPLHYLESHWSALVARLGMDVGFRLVRAGFQALGGGEIGARVGAWRRPASLELERRGELGAVHVRSGAARRGEGVARRLADAVRRRLWEERRIEADWQEAVFPSSSPGSFVMVEAEFARSRAAWCLLGERRVSAERLGDRAARRLLAFLETESAVDAEAADQLAVPLALAGGGGRVSTPVVSDHLLGVVEVARRFGAPIRTWGRPGGPGGVEVERC